MQSVFHRRQGLPDDWLDVVDEHVAVWRRLTDDERDAVGANAEWLLRHKHWEASFGFELTDVMTVTIAVQAGLLVLGLDVDELREVSAVVVYPSAMQSRGERLGPIPGTVSDGPIPILGEAHERRGPVLVAWDQAAAAARHPGHGHNVVLHELAHKLDMVDHLADGAPVLHHRVDPARWHAVCSEVFLAMQAGTDRPPLDPYGATNPAEFFAVATEAFFEAAGALRAREPDLFGILREYYGQDPAERAERPVRSA
jgi:Mlc titration factor MtfA (ptsG expression regulator)